MAPHNSNEKRLGLSSDVKPRLKWTQELHHRFVDAVNQLGGAEKATPKSLLRVMCIRELTLYHLKSHLQKYRSGRSQLPQIHYQIKQEENEESKISQFRNNISVEAQSLLVQMDMQKKFQEQIEVQRHLQLRIEAQGKYLQSVLKRAQDTLFDFSCSSSNVEQVKAQLSQLVSMVDSGCSVESSLTSSDSSGRKGETHTTIDEKDSNYKHKESPITLTLMEMHPEERNWDLSYDFDLNQESVMEFDSGIIDLN